MPAPALASIDTRIGQVNRTVPVHQMVRKDLEAHCHRLNAAMTVLSKRLKDVTRDHVTVSQTTVEHLQAQSVEQLVATALRATQLLAREVAFRQDVERELAALVAETGR